MIGVRRDLIVDFLDKFLEIDRYRKIDYSYNGLIIEGREFVNKVLGVTNITLNSIDYAIKNNFDLIISHHNIFWKNIPLYLKGNLREKVKKILEKEVNVYVAHLPLDYNLEVGNWKWIISLLEDLVRDYRLEEEYGVVLVNLDKDYSIALILDRIKKSLNKYLFGSSKIRKVLFCPGSCSNFILNYLIEKREGIDMVITGEVKMSLYEYCKENGINLIEVGHYNSERFGVRKLLELLKREFNVYVEFFEEEIEK